MRLTRAYTCCPFPNADTTHPVSKLFSTRNPSPSSNPAPPPRVYHVRQKAHHPRSIKLKSAPNPKFPYFEVVIGPFSVTHEPPTKSWARCPPSDGDRLFTISPTKKRYHSADSRSPTTCGVGTPETPPMCGTRGFGEREIHVIITLMIQKLCDPNVALKNGGFPNSKIGISNAWRFHS